MSSSSSMHEFPSISVLNISSSADHPSIEFILSQCHYHVETTCQAKRALDLLQDSSSKSTFDLVIIDMDVHGMDGLTLLTDVVRSMDIPVIALSSTSIKQLIMEGYKYGVCELLIKPVRIEEIQNIWQHVMIRRRNKLDSNNLEWTSGVSLEAPKEFQGTESFEAPWEFNEMDNVDQASRKHYRKRKEHNNEIKESEPLNNDNTLAQKRRRVVWSEDLHLKFTAAVNKLGIDKAVPKRILELMDDENLTRENVASHLQKYRLWLKKSSNKAKKAMPFGDVHSTYHMQPFSRVSFGDHVDSPHDRTPLIGVEDMRSMDNSGYISHSTTSCVSESPEVIDGLQVENHTNINDNMYSSYFNPESAQDHEQKQAKWLERPNMEHEHIENMHSIASSGYVSHSTTPCVSEYFPRNFFDMALNVHGECPQIMQGQHVSMNSAAVAILPSSLLPNSTTLTTLPLGLSSNMGDLGGYQGRCTPPSVIIPSENPYPGGQHLYQKSYYSDMGNLTCDLSDYDPNICNAHTSETDHELYCQGPGSASSFAFTSVASQNVYFKSESNDSQVNYVERREHLPFEDQIQSTHPTMDPQTTHATQEPHGDNSGYSIS